MDRRLHTPHELGSAWGGRPPPADHRLARVISAPEPRRPESHVLSPSHERSPRKRTSPREYPSPHSAATVTSPPTPHMWPPGHSSPAAQDGAPPEKRLRYEYGPRLRDAETRQYDQRFSGRPYSGPAEGGHMHRSYPEPCGNCADADLMLLDVVRAVTDLQSAIALTLSIPAEAKSHLGSAGLDVPHHGLKPALSWILTEVRKTEHLVHDHAAGRQGLPSLMDVVPPPVVDNIRRLSIQSQPSAAPSSIGELHRPPPYTEPGFPRAPHTAGLFDQTPRPVEPTGFATQPREDMKHVPPHKPLAPALGVGHFPASSSARFGAPHSPMQPHSTFGPLPSLSGAYMQPTSPSVPMHQSPTASQAAQATHLQELQHQLSTKTLALQTLQREHEQLLAAFSRSQFRCSALEKKSHVSDHEVNSLAEDKLRLQRHLEALESQVHELTESRDQAQQQSTLDGAQWRQIVAMSSQLQLKGADDARRFKEAQETWDRDRDALRQRIKELEAGGDGVHHRPNPVSSPTLGSIHDSVLASTSLDVLREEIVALRRRCLDLESTLQELAHQAQHIDTAIDTMEHLRKALSGPPRGTTDG